MHALNVCSILNIIRYFILLVIYVSLLLALPLFDLYADDCFTDQLDIVLII